MKLYTDLYQAFEYHIGLENFELVEKILLEITGSRDEYNWHWLLKLKDGRYAYASGGCDYTGWDCQSHADWEVADSFDEALALAPQDVRRVFEDMFVKRDNTGGL